MLKKDGTKNFLWNAVGTAINCFMSFVYVIVITRINGIDISGVFSVCFSVSIIVFTFSNLGNRVYEVSDTVNNDGLYLSLKVISCIIALVCGLLFCAVSGYSFEKFYIASVLIIVRLIESFSDSIYAVFQRNDRLDLVGISYTLKNAAALLLFILTDLIWHNMKISVAMILLATALVYVAFDNMLLYKKFGKPVYTKNMSELLILTKAIGFFVAFNLIIIVIANLPRLIADRFFTSEQMGFFAVIMMIPTVMALLGQTIIQPAIVGLTENYHNGEIKKFKSTTVKILAILVLCAVFCSAAAYYLGPPVLGLILNLELKSYALVMVVAIISGMFSIFTTFISMLLTIMRRTKIQLVLYSANAVTEFVLIFIACKTGELMNIFMGYLGTMILGFVTFIIALLLYLKKEQAVAK